MVLRRSEVEVAVEREIADTAGVVRRYRLTAKYPIEGAGPGPEELAPLYRALSEDLDRSLPPGIPTAPRADRPLTELVETYRPRQPELLDLLRGDGELTEGEYALLRSYLSDPTSAPEADRVATDRPIAAAPLAMDRTPTNARPVVDLLALYRIESLKQAGAVRARRQISYEEYMAIKRHFGATEPAGSAKTGS